MCTNIQMDTNATTNDGLIIMLTANKKRTPFGVRLSSPDASASAGWRMADDPVRNVCNVH
ncbi:MAG: hypothetical protein WC878_03950 [Candidatus Paceibacterota bacterium]